MHAGLGISNLAGAAFCAYPSTGSFARSAVQSTSGAKTGVLVLPCCSQRRIIAALLSLCKSSGAKLRLEPYLHRKRNLPRGRCCHAGRSHASRWILLLCVGLAGLVNATLIGIVLLCLTPVFRHMPLNALAAIVITGVIGLLDFPRVIFLLKASILLAWVCAQAV